MTAYPYETELQVRFRDLDPLGHVNNAVYASYCEQARIDFFQDALGIDSGEVNTVLAHSEIDYRTSIDDLGDVTVGVAVVDVGNTSFEMEYELVFEGDVAATASSVQVVVDPETNQPAPVPDDARAEFAKFER
ncbi:acyl-CoA thioester hydrolase [Halogeometricum rufum]|uniref:Acyl-CoA thioester hydrolase n=1 Tax=Halogeometricum rufum TaxID=553469 RepID=A0A1I6IZM1_9EURY|nr:thioesterase family protein [Halogeometricum rufum]MUV57518.1 acyl-CoA thioesterase [Halogeometricum sp. CBA1124]SFR72212.1 acyl-CoA thioester hydrolase [Halogeometricum rufum]